MSTGVSAHYDRGPKMPLILGMSRVITSSGPLRECGEPKALLTEGARGWDVIAPGGRPAKGIEAAVARFVSAVRHLADVRAVTYFAEADAHRVWTFIARRDKRLRRQVYEKELELMHDFPSLKLDFNVVALDEIPPRPLLPDDLQGCLAYYRESTS